MISYKFHLRSKQNPAADTTENQFSNFNGKHDFKQFAQKAVLWRSCLNHVCVCFYVWDEAQHQVFEGSHSCLCQGWTEVWIYSWVEPADLSSVRPRREWNVLDTSRDLIYSEGRSEPLRSPKYRWHHISIIQSNRRCVALEVGPKRSSQWDNDRRWVFGFFSAIGKYFQKCNTMF